MYNVSNAKLFLFTTTGIIGAFVTEIFGGWDTDVVTLCLFMAMDYILGIVTAGVFHKSNKSESGALSSSAAFKGACRKGVILVLVMIAHRLDLLVGTDFIRSGAVVGFCCNELLSIIENVALMGVPLPAAIKKGLDILKRKAEEDEEDNKDDRTDKSD